MCVLQGQRFLKFGLSNLESALSVGLSLDEARLFSIEQLVRLLQARLDFLFQNARLFESRRDFFVLLHFSLN